MFSPLGYTEKSNCLEQKVYFFVNSERLASELSSAESQIVGPPTSQLDPQYIESFFHLIYSAPPLFAQG